MNQTYPQNGLASLLASKGRNGDSVLVHMTPGEVQGLQALALAHGGSLTINPETGLAEANILKKLLPSIAGFTLNALFPGLGTLGTSLAVAGVTGLAEGSFSKGLKAGLGAYSGASIRTALAKAAEEAAQTAPKVVSVLNPKTAAEELGRTESPVADVINKIAPPAPPVIRPTISLPDTFGGRLRQTGQGLMSLAKDKQGLEKFTEYLGGPKKAGFILSPLATAIQEGELEEQERKMRRAQQADEFPYYYPGAFDFATGTFAPGYYRTASGKPYTPKPFGFASGGIVPVQNPSYPMANLQSNGYSAPLNYNQPTEVVGGYDAKVNPMTGQEIPQTNFADGGLAMIDPRMNPGGDPGMTVGGSSGIITLPAALAMSATQPSDTRRQLIDQYVADLNARLARGIPAYTGPTTNYSWVGSAGEDRTGPGGEGPGKADAGDYYYSGDTFGGVNANDRFGGIGGGMGIVPGAGTIPDQPSDWTTLEPTWENIDEQLLKDTLEEVGPGQFELADEALGRESLLDKAKESVLPLALNAMLPGAGTVYSAWQDTQPKTAGFTIIVPDINYSGEPGTIPESVAQQMEADVAAQEEPVKEEAPVEEPVKEEPIEETGGDRRGLLQDRYEGASDSFGGTSYFGKFDMPQIGNLLGRSGLIEITELGNVESNYAGGQIKKYAAGGLGSLPQYRAGGKYLQGPGDGMSDDIKANIEGRQEARLADGEFVIPADVVSHLGNGSSNAGAKKLHQMMNRIRAARTGRKRQAPAVKADRYLPA